MNVRSPEGCAWPEIVVFECSLFSLLSGLWTWKDHDFIEAESKAFC